MVEISVEADRPLGDLSDAQGRSPARGVQGCGSLSKAFTKDDDDAGFEAPRSALMAVPAGPFRLTSTGARRAKEHDDPRVREAAGRAEALPRVAEPERATLGVTVVARTSAAKPTRYRLVSAEERALLGEGCSVEGPIGAALLGARVGDVREVVLPRGVEELEVIELEGEILPGGRS